MLQFKRISLNLTKETAWKKINSWQLKQHNRTSGCIWFSVGVIVGFLFQENLTRDLKVDGCQSNLCVMLKQLLFFYKFYDFLCKRHSLVNWPCYNNWFQIMEHSNFRNLIRVIFTQQKHLETRANVFWYCCKVIKR